MKKLHEKSPCCQEKILRFGKRRRQCKICQRTWRVWQKKRGRKKKRISPEFVKKYLRRETPSIYSLARVQNRNESTLKTKLKRSLFNFLKIAPWPQIPSDAPLIVIADAMIIKIDKKIYTFYFILLKPLGSDRAIITEPHIKEGPEAWLGWQESFTGLPKTVFASICALVSDRHTGLVSLARNALWAHQGCVFHLLARIQGRRSRWARSRHQAEGKRLCRLVRKVVESSNDNAVKFALSELTKIIGVTNSPAIKKILSGFIRYYKDYRVYLDYPELDLPRTSNSAESVISSIRQLLYRAHGFRTLNSLKLWVCALLKTKQTIVCRGYFSTKFPA